MKETELFMCLLLDGVYWYAYKHPKLCRFASREAEVHKVRVSEAEEEGAKYFAWWDFERSEFRYVYPHRGMVSMAFPYGHKVAEEKGEGKLLPVSVTFLEKIDV